MDATADAPVQPNYFSQVAAHIIDADTARFSGKYRDALIKTFVGRLIVPESAVHALTASQGEGPRKARGPHGSHGREARRSRSSTRLS